MSKWLIVATHPYDEIKGSTGGFLTKLYLDLQKENIELEVHERPYIVYVAIADEDTVDKGHISINQTVHEIYEVSQELKFNYNILLKGREFYNKLNSIHIENLSNLIRREINFVRPEWLFIPQSNRFSSDSIIVNKVCKDILFIKNKIPNVLEYGCDYSDVFSMEEKHISPNYFISIDRNNLINPIDLLYKISHIYKSQIRVYPYWNSWELNYYKLSLYGSFIGKDFAEGFSVLRIVNDSKLFDFSNLEKKIINKENSLKLEDIL